MYMSVNLVPRELWAVTSAPSKVSFAERGATRVHTIAEYGVWVTCSRSFWFGKIRTLSHRVAGCEVVLSHRTPCRS